MTEFSFSPVGQARDAAIATGFVPMGLFDTSEMQNSADVPVPEETPADVGPPGITLTEEELDQQLRDSFNSGLQEGKNLAERGLVNVFRSLRSATEGIVALREKVMRESEDELVSLIMLVARKVILREVAQDRSILSNIVEAAISHLPERDEITVRMNPDDHALITTSHQEYFRQELMNGRMHLKADPTIVAGSCQIDTELGTIDASLDAQLDEIYRRLLEERSIATETAD